MELKSEDERGRLRSKNSLFSAPKSFGGHRVVVDGVEEWVGSSVWCSFNEVEGNPGLGLVS